MARRIESLFLPGEAGPLEALLEEPETSPVEAALVCHPHPKGGGTMHNKVVYRMARGMRQSGCVILRFNFRGVNLSAGAFDGGRGELEDARVALAFLRSRYSSLPVLVSGFSFGSRIALQLAGQQDGLSRVIAAGFPTTKPSDEYIHKVTIPKFFVHSTRDHFGPYEQLAALYETLQPPKQLSWVAAADHFFQDALDEFESIIRSIGLSRISGEPVNPLAAAYAQPVVPPAD